ncbi:MAG: alpha/beta hydrolase-fold protein [Candidatus Electryonea clarkiae]|nr:alpha/beta hydrolase-fold protein [Candidatus Electryonea clarkiae]MDP8287695.1 alpha/beta hydrolase-fold protein [Candidatus Electryonea clarkiae]
MIIQDKQKGIGKSWILKTRSLSIFFILIYPIILLAIEPGGPTLGTRAERALVSGEIKLAIEMYAKWLEAVPGDNAAWYNYSCALSLEGKLDESFQAFDDAVTAGWRDSSWPPKDPDLDAIKELPDFARIISRIEGLLKLEQQSSPSGKLTYYLEQTRVASYQVILPSDYREEGQPHPLIVLLHGRTGDFDSFAEFPDRLALPGIIYVIPRAPYKTQEGQTGYEYWPRALRTSNNLQMLDNARNLTTGWISAIVSDVANKTNADTSNVILIGFSQGASTTLLTLLDSPALFRSGAVIGGFLPLDHEKEYDFTGLATNNVSLFVIHGSRDRVIEPYRAEKVIDAAKVAKVNIISKFYPAEHEITDEMVVNLSEWIVKLTGESSR